MIKKSTKGQTALILILLTATALIFLAITLNWGRIAQTKTMLTIAANQSASLMASNVASYGQELKQTNLQDTNEFSYTTSVFLALVYLLIAIIAVIVTQGAALATLGLYLAIATLALQVVVIQPMITSLWNRLQVGQPIQQQFYEGGVASAIQGAVTDQVTISDYFDWNANGRYGTGATNPSNDTVSRFAVFYTDRLKMLNKGYIPQVVLFYNQLKEFMSGATCLQNYTDNQTSAIPINSSCIDPGSGKSYCAANSSDPACTQKIPSLITCTQNAYENSLDSTIPLNFFCPADCLSSSPANPTACKLLVSNAASFQLSDPCTDSDSSLPTYNPYCDPCCQTDTAANNTKSPRPSYCPQTGVPGQCKTNNPYGSSYPYIYDPSYQEYANGVSFLDQFGRDEQKLPSSPPFQPLPGMNPIGNPQFPNGIYPLFWLLKDYSPQADNIDPASATCPSGGQDHWCVAGTYNSGTCIIPPAPVPAGFTDLTQLGQSSFSLPYSCTGKNCCVDSLMSSVSTSANTANINITIGTALPVVTISDPKPAPASYVAGGAFPLSATVTEPSGIISSVVLTINGNTLNPSSYTWGQAAPGQYSIQAVNPVVGFPIPSCDSSTSTDTGGSYTLSVTATDAAGIQGNGSVTITISADPATCAGPSGFNCGTDKCGVSCGICAASASCISSSPGMPGKCCLTACPAGDNCGSIPDGCGNTITCPPDNCSSGNQKCTSNVCTCAPNTCPAGNTGDACGSLSDGCLGTMTCGCLPTHVCGASNTCS
ncbi:MAG: hypothetical protein HQL12_04990 [Candidatus Omnitrophica bacterium]|nr:hypothetical protein [Candidatus Omnitrophota bacterium]